MGCDGGTIPRRDELVKVKRRPESKDKDYQLAFQWRCCYLSQQALQDPIVMCGLGHLYNKIALIEGLLNRASMPEGVQHIKSLKDVKNLNFTPNPIFKPGDEKKEGGIDSRAAPHICPVIGLEITGKFRFVALWSCGCVFSERALKEISTKNCHKCQQPFVTEDVIVLNGTEEDMVLLRTNMENRQQKNKKPKEKKVKVETVVSSTTVTPTASSEPSTSVPCKIVQTGNNSNGASASGSNKIHHVGGQLESKRKNMADLKEKVKKLKQDYSVAKDPQVTDVYKSLFTTHQSEKQQNRAHWITYNPFYN